RICGRIEVCCAAEHVDRDRVGLHLVFAAGKILFGDEAQEFAVALGAMELGVGQYPVELAPRVEFPDTPRGDSVRESTALTFHEEFPSSVDVFFLAPAGNSSRKTPEINLQLRNH